MPASRLKMLLAAAMLAAVTALLPASASAATKSSSGGAAAPAQSSGSGASNGSQATASNGGISPNDPQFRPTGKAKLVNGIAIPPADAPPAVVNMITAANSISGMPYKWGGGHGSFVDNGYDCSGTVSFVLNGGGLLGGGPLDSGSFMKWGLGGAGRWVTVYTNPGHAFIMIAGLRFDTGYRDRRIRGLLPGTGPRWGRVRPTTGFVARHPAGY
jgi:hypothetical protein